MLDADLSRGHGGHVDLGRGRKHAMRTSGGDAGVSRQQRLGRAV